MKKLKELFQKPIFKKIISPIVRGAIKQVPIIGTPVAEVLTNATQPDGQPKKHNWLSIGVQVLIAVAVVYSFYTGAITLDDLVKFLQQFI